MSQEVVQGNFCLARVHMELSPCVGDPHLTNLQLLLAHLNALLLKLLALLLKLLALLLKLLAQLNALSRSLHGSSLYGSKAGEYGTAPFDSKRLQYFESMNAAVPTKVTPIPQPFQCLSLQV